MNEITQDEKRIRIAKHLGVLTYWGSDRRWHVKDGGFFSFRSNGSMAMRLPDYFGSLDAMTEARKSLTPEQQERFAQMLANQLWISCGNSKSISLTYHGVFQLIDATAAQHAEAFGKAMSLW